MNEHQSVVEPNGVELILSRLPKGPWHPSCESVYSTETAVLFGVTHRVPVCDIRETEHAGYDRKRVATAISLLPDLIHAVDDLLMAVPDGSILPDSAYHESLDAIRQLMGALCLPTD